MAETSISVSQDQFMCPVCVDLLTDPVTIPCGHSYCIDCINGCWDQEDQNQRGVHTCPKCRQTFSPRPALCKNTILAEMVEKLKTTRPQAAAAADAPPPARCSGEPGDVECDSCIGKKEKAVKSCLTCLVSFCQTHLQPHLESPAFQRHTLVKASAHLQDQICSTHNRAIELWCETDQQFLCHLCKQDAHSNHKTVSVTAGRIEAVTQKYLEEIQRKIQQRIQEREQEVQELRQAVESIRRSVQAAVEDSEKIFTELMCSVERRRYEVTEQIRDQERSELNRTEGILKRLEQEIADLRKRDTELEQLSHTEDHMYFFQNLLSLYACPGSEDLPSTTVSPHLSFEDVGKSVSLLRERLEDFCKEEFGRFSTKDSYELTLDPDTAYKYLRLSEGNTVVTSTDTDQQHPDCPERFNGRAQVLCRESVPARCYWEVEWSGNNGVYIAVSYKSIRRRGQAGECVFGYNDKSWSLFCCSSRYVFWHKFQETRLDVQPSPSRIGVYVDHGAGTLAFYSILTNQNKKFLLHRVQATFTAPLYAGFGLDANSEVKICHFVCYDVK